MKTSLRLHDFYKIFRMPCADCTYFHIFVCSSQMCILQHSFPLRTCTHCHMHSQPLEHIISRGYIMKQTYNMLSVYIINVLKTEHYLSKSF